jgi:hypothetical protein
MKQLTVREDGVPSVNSFFDTETDMYVKCAYIGGQNCGPRCAACRVDKANGMADVFRCERGDFAIGSVNT